MSITPARQQQRAGALMRLLSPERSFFVLASSPIMLCRVRLPSSYLTFLRMECVKQSAQDPAPADLSAADDLPFTASCLPRTLWCDGRDTSLRLLDQPLLPFRS